MRAIAKGDEGEISSVETGHVAMSISRRLEDARRAFDKRDLKAAEAHAAERIAASATY